MSIVNKVRLGFSLPLVLLVLGGAASFRNADEVRERGRELMDVANRLEALKLWSRSLREVEYAQRGYLLTGRRENREQMRAAQVELREHEETLREFSGTNPVRREMVDMLASLAAERFTLAERLMTLRDQKGAVAAAGEVASGVGERLSRRSGDLVSQMEALETRRLDQLNMDAEAGATSAMTFSGYGALLSFLFVGGASVWIGRQIATPVRTLAAAAERIGGGVLDYRIPGERDDEFGVLVRAFNTMGSRLQNADERLRHRGAILHSVLTNISDGVTVADMGGKFLYFNPAAEQILGVSPTDAGTREWSEHWGLFYPDGRTPYPPEELALARAIRGESTDDVELFLRNTAVPQGAHLLASGRPLRGETGVQLGGVAVFRDVTERMAIQQAIENERNLLRTVIDCLPESIYAKDTQGRYLVANANLQKTLDTESAADLVAHGKLDSLPAELEERHFQADAAVVRTGTPLIEVEEPYVDAEGIAGWIETTRVPLRQAGSGGIIGMVGVYRDITERKHNLERIESLNTTLRERANELEAANKELEAFSYSVSHDLRAPLRHINGFAELLVKKAGPVLDAQCQRYVETITRSASEMGALIDDLLVFSRMGRMEMLRTPVSLDRLVREVAEGLDRNLQGRSVRWDIGALPQVDGDPAMLRQVFANLLENALKYTRNREVPEIEVGSRTGEAGETVVYVRDNGVGFDMQYAGKLFGVFQRLHSSKAFEGTGIGLANVRRIIQRHGGQTWAQGAVDEGATFYFSIPVPVEKT